MGVHYISYDNIIQFYNINWCFFAIWKFKLQARARARAEQMPARAVALARPALVPPLNMTYQCSARVVGPRCFIWNLLRQFHFNFQQLMYTTSFSCQCLAFVILFILSVVWNENRVLNKLCVWKEPTGSTAIEGILVRIGFEIYIHETCDLVIHWKLNMTAWVFGVHSKISVIKINKLEKKLYNILYNIYTNVDV